MYPLWIIFLVPNLITKSLSLFLIYISKKYSNTIKKQLQQFYEFWFLPLVSQILWLQWLFVVATLIMILHCLSVPIASRFSGPSLGYNSYLYLMRVDYYLYLFYLEVNQQAIAGDTCSNCIQDIVEVIQVCMSHTRCTQR